MTCTPPLYHLPLFFFTGSPQVFLFRDVVAVVKMLKVCIEGKKIKIKIYKCGRVGVCKTPPCLRAFVSAFFSSSLQMLLNEEADHYDYITGVGIPPPSRSLPTSLV